MWEIQLQDLHLKSSLLCLIQGLQLCMPYLQNAKKDVLRDLKNLTLINLSLLLIMVIKDKIRITEKGLLLGVLLLINFALLKILRNAQILSFYKLMGEMIYNKINSVELLDQHHNPLRKNLLHQHSLGKSIKCFHSISVKALARLEI